MFYTGRSKLNILVDPLSVHLDASQELIHQQVALTMMLHYLPAIGENKVEVEIFFPEFLWDNSWRENYYSFIPGEEALQGHNKATVLKKREVSSDFFKEQSKKIKEFLESKKGQYLKLPRIDLRDPKTLINSLEDGSLLTYRDAEYIYKYGYLELIDLYSQYRCDLLLTSNRLLHAEKKSLKEKFRVFVVDYPEVYKEVETFLKGHHIYVSHSNPIYGLDASSFYPMTDPKLHKYFELWNKVLAIKKDQKISEYFRRMFYHRYSFMKYTIDQIKFHLFQAERLEDEKLRSRHYFLASYHLNSFYFILWGYLDNLAWVFNYLFNLGFSEKDPIRVSFSNKEYRKKLKINALQVLNLLSDQKIQKWLSALEVKRHPAAHREPLFMSSVYDERDMSLISERMVVVSTKNGQAIFDAVNHLNYDIEQMDEFMEKVCNLFDVKTDNQQGVL